jgi:hypothetical protein
MQQGGRGCFLDRGSLPRRMHSLTSIDRGCAVAGVGGRLLEWIWLVGLALGGAVDEFQSVDGRGWACM